MLTGHAADLAAVTTAWADQWWDDEVGLLWCPPDPPGPTAGAGADPAERWPDPAFHLLPQSGWYAVGLLERNGPGDRARAIRALHAVLDHQYDEPGEVWHGTFALMHEWPHPPADARMWVDYDPNWRQFVGCTLLLALRRQPDRLTPDLTARADRALRLAVEGEPVDRIPDNYANIALMHAFVEVEAGHRLGEPAWIERGEQRARAVAAGYDRHDAFEEWGSPTYEGIDLLALGLWREHGSSAVLADLGRRLEAALWRDAARWYHAGLGNRCGPYTRAYGMDLHTHVGAWTLWLWAALGRDHAPLPDLDRPLAHGMDLCLGPVAALVGTVVPGDAVEALIAFGGGDGGERLLHQRIAGPEGGDRVATGWLGPEVALGGERAGVDLSWWDQHHAATAHWRRSDGRVGWLRIRAPGPSDARAERRRLTITWHHAEPPEAGVGLLVACDDPDAATVPISVSSTGPPPARTRRGWRYPPAPGADRTVLVVEAL